MFPGNRITPQSLALPLLFPGVNHPDGAEEEEADLHLRLPEVVEEVNRVVVQDQRLPIMARVKGQMT